MPRKNGAVGALRRYFRNVPEELSRNAAMVLEFSFFLKNFSAPDGAGSDAQSRWLLLGVDL